MPRLILPHTDGPREVVLESGLDCVDEDMVAKKCVVLVLVMLVERSGGWGKERELGESRGCGGV